MENSCRWDRAALKSYRFKPMLKFQGFRWLLREAVPGLRPDLIFSRKPGTETLRILTPRSQDEKKKTPRGDENYSCSPLWNTWYSDEKKKTPRGDENFTANAILCPAMNEKRKPRQGTVLVLSEGTEYYGR